MEKWKDIEGYENLYQVSSKGRVKSLWHNKEKILKGCKDKDGYLKVSLYKEGKQKTFKVHRLVASAFLPNLDNLPEINHRNEDKTDNRVENIEYCDRTYNNNYGKHNEKMAKSKYIPILQFTKNNEFVRRWDSAKEVQKELGIDKSSICSCCKGKRKSAGGFIWGYADDYERIQFKVFDLEIYEKKVA